MGNQRIPKVGDWIRRSDWSSDHEWMPKAADGHIYYQVIDASLLRVTVAFFQTQEEVAAQSATGAATYGIATKPGVIWIFKDTPIMLEPSIPYEDIERARDLIDSIAAG